jgi:hypothetical protein
LKCRIRGEKNTMTPCPIPTDIALRYRPSRFKCFKCATTHADFFATKGSLQKPPEVVPLCFQCYVQKRRWIWRLVKENNKKQQEHLAEIIDTLPTVVLFVAAIAPYVIPARRSGLANT